MPEVLKVGDVVLHQGNSPTILEDAENVKAEGKKSNIEMTIESIKGNVATCIWMENSVTKKREINLSELQTK